MAKHNPKNERVKHRYLAYLEEAKRMAPASAEAAAAAIALFEESTGFKDFSAFHIEQARRFKRLLNDAANPKTGKPLAKSTIHSRLMAVKAFFHWLAGQPGYKSRITYADCEYFNPSANDSRIATAKRPKRTPTPEQIKHVLSVLPHSTPIEKRDRALIAFAYLSGARDDAIASLNLGHVDFEKRSIFQDARMVRTKNRKTFTSDFFPVGEEIESIVGGWLSFLTDEMGFGPDDPLFPSTLVQRNEDGLFAPTGLSRQHWRNADAIRRIFRQSFEAAGLPYFHPHSFRRTLALLGQKLCKTPEALKAWSQNLGHDAVLTTLTSYGEISAERQSEIMQVFSKRAPASESDSPPPEAIEWMRRQVAGNT